MQGCKECCCAVQNGNEALPEKLLTLMAMVKSVGEEVEGREPEEKELKTTGEGDAGKKVLLPAECGRG